MMKYISLFSGIGGFELGIHQASEKMGIELECVFSSEIDKYARQIYEKNFGVEPYGDITRINEGDIPDHDMLVGGFPCQAFSIAGKRCGFEDTRGTLFFEIARIAKYKGPKILLLENVRGLLSHDKGRTFETILKTLDDIGYDVEWQVLNSKNFGVPQNRERVFIIGHLRGSSGRKIFPIRQNDNPFITKGGEQASNAVVSRTLTATDAKMHLDGNYILVKEAIKQGYIKVNPGDSINYSQPNSKTRCGRVGKDIANTLDTGCLQGVLTEDIRIRRLTPKECERLQGFPDNWTKYGIKDGEIVNISDSQRYKCIGNAVSVPVIEAIITELFK